MASGPVAEGVASLADFDTYARQSQIARAWQAYEGKHPRSLRVKPGQNVPDDNVKINLSKLIVLTGVSFLFGRDPGLRFALSDVEPPEGSPEDSAEDWLRACWRVNRQHTTLRKIGINGAVCGHSFLRIDDRPWDGKPYPRLIVLDPATVTADYEPDDYENVYRYTIQTTGVKTETKEASSFRQIIERQDDGTWTIVDQVSKGNSKVWENRIAPEPWPHQWAPIVHCQNLPMPNQLWGVADLEQDVIELNYKINYVLTNWTKIVRLHAHPKTWTSGLTPEQVAAIDSAPDKLIALPGDNAELHNLEMISDLSSARELYERLLDLLHAVTRVPRIVEVPNLSALALAILYQPLVDMTGDKRATYGDMLVELNRRLLDLGKLGDSNITQQNWPAILPADPQAQAQAAVIKRQVGVSEQTVLEELGYDSEVEAERRAQDTTPVPPVAAKPADVAPVPSGRTGATGAGIPAGDDS